MCASLLSLCAAGGAQARVALQRSLAEAELDAVRCIQQLEEAARRAAAAATRLRERGAVQRSGGAGGGADGVEDVVLGPR
jgi:hypothetical protein